MLSTKLDSYFLVPIGMVAMIMFLNTKMGQFMHYYHKRGEYIGRDMHKEKDKAVKFAKTIKLYGW